MYTELDIIENILVKVIQNSTVIKGYTSSTPSRLSSKNDEIQNSNYAKNLLQSLRKSQELEDLLLPYYKRMNTLLTDDDDVQTNLPLIDWFEKYNV